MASSHIVTLTEANFAPEVLQSALPVVVSFDANWCIPCRMLDPLLQDLSEEFVGRAKFVKVDIETDAGLATKYNVTFVPTVILFKGGEVAGKIAGLRPRKDFLAGLNPLTS